MSEALGYCQEINKDVKRSVSAIVERRVAVRESDLPNMRVLVGDAVAMLGRLDKELKRIHVDVYGARS